MDGGDILLFNRGTSASWTATAGALYLDAGATTPYTSGLFVPSVYLKAYNRTIPDGKITAAGSEIATIKVNGVIPDYPHYPMEWEAETRGTVISISRSGRVRGRVLADEGMKRDYKLIYADRKPADVLVLEEFFDYHYPDRVFKYRNLWHGIDGYFRFDARLKGKATSRMKGTIEFAISEVTPG